MKPAPRPAALALKKAAGAAADKLRSRPPQPPFALRPGGKPTAADVAAARLEVESILRNVKRTRIGQSKEVAAVERYLVSLIARGGSYEDFAADMRRRAEGAVSQHRSKINKAAALARLLSPPNIRQRFVAEVVNPAQSRSISGPQAWSRTDAIVGRDVRANGETAPPPGWTIFPCAQAGVSAILGLQYAAGICGLAHGMVCWARTGSVSIGASVGVSFGAGVSLSPKPPPQLAGVALSIGVGIAYGAGFDVGVGLVPSVLGKPDDSEELTLATVLDGFSVAITGGGEINISIGFAFTEVFTLVDVS
ncbi:MAG: hypothetical protein WD749_07655 [Phycisphaerales bacterium]